MLGSDRFLQALKQGAGQQSNGYKTTVYGRVSSYDPALHRVKVLLPSFRNEDGSPATTPWLPLGSAWVGNGFGLQIAPLGGATPQNPGAGEACVVTLIERTYGVTAAAHLIYDDLSAPPAVALAAGEAIAKHQSGTQVYFKTNGDLDITTTGQTNVTAQGNVSVTTQGTAEVSSQGAATVTSQTSVTVVAPIIRLTKSLSDTLYGLCTSLLQTWLVGHVHSNGNAGANTGVPTTSPPAGSTTSVVSGE